MTAPKQIQIFTKEEINAALASRSSNLRQWAIKNDYAYITVYTAVKRWGGVAKRPHGGISREIMAKIADYVAEQSSVIDQQTEIKRENKMETRHSVTYSEID